MNKRISTFIFIIAASLISGCVKSRPGVSEIHGDKSDRGIIGGRPVAREYFKTIGVAMLLDTETGEMCSATLITGRTLLTAAHCLPKDDHALKVFFDLNPLAESSEAVSFEVESTHVHPDYLMSTAEQSVDLALVVLKTLAPDFVAVVRIPKINETELTSGVLLYGFGKTTGNDDDTAGTLHSVAVEVAKNSEKFFEVDQSLGGGICDGDSGGPAMTMSMEGMTLVGVSKMDSDKDGQGKDACSGMGQFTKVEPYLGWIAQVSIY